MYIHVDYYSYICTYRQPTNQWQIDRVSVADKPIDDAHDSPSATKATGRLASTRCCAVEATPGRR